MNKIIPQIVEPFGKDERLYICGENFSNHQAWMEGALQTSELVVSELNKTINTQKGGNKKRHRIDLKRSHSDVAMTLWKCSWTRFSNTRRTPSGRQ